MAGGVPEDIVQPISLLPQPADVAAPHRAKVDQEVMHAQRTLLHASASRRQRGVKPLAMTNHQLQVSLPSEFHELGPLRISHRQRNFYEHILACLETFLCVRIVQRTRASDYE